MAKHKVTLIPGDGVGPEVIAAARRVMDAGGARIAWDVVQAGATLQGNPLPAAVLDSIKRNRIALKGPTETPPGEVRIGDRSYPGVTIALRKELDLYAAVRPVRNYPGVASRYQNVDFIIFRENSEDLYAGMESMPDADTAHAIKRITRGATERIARFALDEMRRLGRKRLTIIHKANILKMTDGLFLKVAREVAKEYPEIEVNDRIVDAMCMELVVRPEIYDAVLAPNLYGDLVSDIGAGLVGGLGVAASANIGGDTAMFEAVHGSAPDLAGRDVANPMATIAAGVMMLQHLGETDAARRIDQALIAVLNEGKHLPRDLGGQVGTREMADAVVAMLQD